MVAGARARGLDVTTEAYPYIAGFTEINSTLFNPGWREKLGVGYDPLQMPDTGERFAKERFDQLHSDLRPTSERSNLTLSRHGHPEALVPQ